LSNLKLLKLHKSKNALLEDLRRLVQAGITPKSGPWNSETLGWTRDTWNRAQELDIQLLSRNLYSERLGPLREVVKQLHLEEGVPHAGFAKVSLGGDAQDMIKDLAIFYLVYRYFPERDKANQGRGGWSLSTIRCAKNSGISLASVTKYKYWFGSVDEAEQLALQLIRHGYNGNQPVTGIMSQLNFVPPHVNKRSFINFIQQHPRWNLKPNQPLPIPVLAAPEEEPTVDPTPTSPFAGLTKLFDQPKETSPVDYSTASSPAPAPTPQPTEMPAQLTPKYLPGTIVLVSYNPGQWTLAQVDEVVVRWTRTGTSEFAYKVTDSNGTQETMTKRSSIISPDEFVDQLASLAQLAEKRELPLNEWRDEHPLTST
jgi:hypothetical protein